MLLLRIRHSTLVEALVLIVSSFWRFLEWSEDVGFPLLIYFDHFGFRLLQYVVLACVVLQFIYLDSRGRISSKWGSFKLILNRIDGRGVLKFLFVWVIILVQLFKQFNMPLFVPSPFTVCSKHRVSCLWTWLEVVLAYFHIVLGITHFK